MPLSRSLCFPRGLRSAHTLWSLLGDARAPEGALSISKRGVCLSGDISSV